MVLGVQRAGCVVCVLVLPAVAALREVCCTVLVGACARCGAGIYIIWCDMLRESFVFYKSFYEAIRGLPRDIQGEIYTAIMEYGLYGEEPVCLKPIARCIFTLVKPQIDANNARYENGRKGGRKGAQKQEDASETKPEQGSDETDGKRVEDLDETKPEPTVSETGTEPEPMVDGSVTEGKPSPNRRLTEPKPTVSQTGTGPEPNVNGNVNENVNKNADDYGEGCAPAREAGVCAASTGMDVLARRERFREMLRPFVGRYGEEMVGAFFRYWSELSLDRLHMRYELGQTFEIPSRLGSWAAKEGKFGGPGGPVAAQHVGPKLEATCAELEELKRRAGF